MKMLVEAKHAEETRVVVIDGSKIEEYDYETSIKKSIKGNIYLARISRIEPSLQAAFLEFKGERHGFLPFADINPLYYASPKKEEGWERDLVEEEVALAFPQGEEILEEDMAEETSEEFASIKRPFRGRHLIQDVLRKGQMMLVQVVKDERGTKGASLTTYITLSGRYCVLMPNTAQGWGISRKITDALERTRLRKVATDLKIPESMGLLIRTSGSGKRKLEIKRDLEYLMRLWELIQEKASQQEPPFLVHAEHDLITKSLRDFYPKAVEEVWVEGEEGYKHAKKFMKLFMPSHAKRILHHKDTSISLFQHYQVEQQLDAMQSHHVRLPSGGYLVFNQTEALVAIDVNSGRSIREKHMEDTAIKTNLEAAGEIPRQLRLRDLAGLIVVDFIDMNHEKQKSQVEKKIKDELKKDRAKVQVGSISQFGLLELSRQRLRPSLLEAHTLPCPLCRGIGVVRSVESAVLKVLRMLEQQGSEEKKAILFLPLPVLLYLINHKRQALANLEKSFHWDLQLKQDETLIMGEMRLEYQPIFKQETALEPPTDIRKPLSMLEEKAKEKGAMVQGNTELATALEKRDDPLLPIPMSLSPAIENAGVVDRNISEDEHGKIIFFHKKSFGKGKQKGGEKPSQGVSSALKGTMQPFGKDSADIAIKGTVTPKQGSKKEKDPQDNKPVESKICVSEKDGKQSDHTMNSQDLPESPALKPLTIMPTPENAAEVKHTEKESVQSPSATSKKGMQKNHKPLHKSKKAWGRARAEKPSLSEKHPLHGSVAEIERRAAKPHPISSALSKKSYPIQDIPSKGSNTPDISLEANESALHDLEYSKQYGSSNHKQKKTRPRIAHTRPVAQERKKDIPGAKRPDTVSSSGKQEQSKKQKSHLRYPKDTSVLKSKVAQETQALVEPASKTSKNPPFPTKHKGSIFLRSRKPRQLREKELGSKNQSQESRDPVSIKLPSKFGAAQTRVKFYEKTQRKTQAHPMFVKETQSQQPPPLAKRLHK